LLRQVVAEPVVLAVLARAVLGLGLGLEQAVRALLAAVAQVAAATLRIPNEAGKALPAPLVRATRPHRVRTVQPELDGKSNQARSRH